MNHDRVSNDIFFIKNDLKQFTTRLHRRFPNARVSLRDTEQQLFGQDENNSKRLPTVIAGTILFQRLIGRLVVGKFFYFCRALTTHFELLK